MSQETGVRSLDAVSPFEDPYYTWAAPQQSSSDDDDAVERDNSAVDAHDSICGGAAASAAAADASSSSASAAGLSSAEAPEPAESSATVHPLQTASKSSAEAIVASIKSFCSMLSATTLTTNTSAGRLIVATLASAVTFTNVVTSTLAKITGISEHMLGGAKQEHNLRQSPPYGHELAAASRADRSDKLAAGHPAVLAITAFLLTSELTQWSPNRSEVYIDPEDGAVCEKLLYAVYVAELHAGYVEYVNDHAADGTDDAVPADTIPISLNSFKTWLPRWCQRDKLRTCVCMRCDGIRELLQQLRPVLGTAHQDCADDSGCECKVDGSLRKQLIDHVNITVDDFLERSVCQHGNCDPLDGAWPQCRQFRSEVAAARKTRKYKTETEKEVRVQDVPVRRHGREDDTQDVRHCGRQTCAAKGSDGEQGRHQHREEEVDSRMGA
jgi:hypothetical protein